jgi:phytoene synthase
MVRELREIIDQKTKSNFHYTFLFLPKAKKEALITTYSFCRITDDIVDLENIAPIKKIELLKYWQDEFEESITSKSELNILNDVSRVIKEFDISTNYFRDLIKGVEMDISPKRYRTFDELYEYCYLVASTVGLMSIEIFGYRNRATRDYAINLGIAMQLTNILRDLKYDSKIGRIYLPQEDMIRFNYTEEELLRETYNDNFVRLMNFETNRADDYYKEATRLLQTSDRRNLFSARAMQHIYARLLNKIRDKNFNVFKKKIKLPRFTKMLIAMGVWVKYKMVY